MFENEFLNGLMGAVFGILIPGLIAIKLLSWFLDSLSELVKPKRITMKDRLKRKAVSRL
jgi:hypothetical protein